MAVVVLLAVVGLAGFLLGRSSNPVEEASPSPSQPSVPPEPSPTLTPELTPPPEPSKTDANFPGLARGDRLTMRVYVIDESDLENTRCTVHRFGGEGAYVTNCPSIEQRTDKELILVAVVLTNTSDEPLSFNLERFLLSARSGATYDPVDVRADWDYAPVLLPREGLIPPGKSRQGLITFDGRVGFRVAESLTYADDDQALTVHFAGKPTSEVV